MLPSLWEARIRAAHNAEVERVTAEYQKGFNDLVNLALDAIAPNMITIQRLQARVERLEEAKNTAYSERQKMVQALTFIFPAHMKRHPDSDTEWENDWRNIVCVHGPAGQMTWHIHDSEAHMFGHLNRKPDHFAACEYDGHTTDEKYRRLLDSVLSRFCSGAADAAENRMGRWTW